MSLCSSLDLSSLCASPLSQFARSEIRDPISRVDASVSWLCHFGEKPFSLCLCLGCCVSRVFNTSFFAAVSPCQEIGTSLSGRLSLATGDAANAMNSGTGPKAPSLLSMLTRDAHWGIGLRRYRPFLFQLVRFASLAGDDRTSPTLRGGAPAAHSRRDTRN